MNPSAPGRGPGRLKHWYEVRMFDGEVFRGRYMAVDFTEDDRAKHELEFDLEDGTTRTILYGDLEAAMVLNPRLRRRKGLST